jgi:Na+/phosphate symporter
MRKDRDVARAMSPLDSSVDTAKGNMLSQAGSKTLTDSKKRKNTHIVSLADSADQQAKESLKQIRRHIMRKLRRSKRREREYANMLHRGAHATEENKRTSDLRVFNNTNSPAASEKSADAAGKSKVPEINLNLIASQT